jgi:hypothetical protein
MPIAEPGWSLAELIWDDSPAVGVRWNGDPNEPGVGNPQSRGLPTWLILPRPLAEIAIDRVREHIRGGDSHEAAEVPPRRRLLDLIAFVRAGRRSSWRPRVQSDGIMVRRLSQREFYNTILAKRTCASCKRS